MMRRSKTMALAALALAGILVGSVFGQTIGTIPEFGISAVEQEAYWYSRYNLGHLTMRAGMGEVFMPEMADVEAMIAMADADPYDGDTVTPPTNPALLRTVYAGGLSNWIVSADPADFATLRWDEASFDRRLTGAGLGWTIVKELEWAKQFHIDSHFGTPEADFGAQWRFMGLVLTAMAVEQAEVWIELHAANEMVMLDASDPFVMLMALSNLSELLGAEAMPHSGTNRYRDVDRAASFRAVADEHFDRVVEIPMHRMSVKELATAIQGLTWYAAVTQDAVRQASALDRIGQLAGGLLTIEKRTAAERGYALRGLIEAHRVRSCIDCLQESLDLFEELAVDYDDEHGIFTSQLSYSIDDVAALVGGLNAARSYVDADRGVIEEMLVGFFEGTVNLSGLQRSVPPIASGKSPFEQNEPAIFYGYPGLPLPSEVGDFGAAPVFASSVTFDSAAGAWSEADPFFDTAGAMHAANEFIWLHADQVNGFPEVVELEPEPAAQVHGDLLPGGNPLGMILFLAIAVGSVAALILSATGPGTCN